MRDPFVERLRHFYESSRAELFMYALSITREPQSAEDAVQAAFCAVLRQKRPPLELRPYVYSVSVGLTSLRSDTLSGGLCQSPIRIV